MQYVFQSINFIRHLAVFILITSSTVSSSDIPKIKKFSFEENVQEGDLASVTCIAISSNKPLSFMWYKNGQKIDITTSNIRIDNSGEYSILILDNVSINSAGNYTCTVSNPSGSTSHTAQLIVKAPPKWIERPIDLITTIGSAASFRCMASGSPRPKITWMKILDSKNSSEYKTVETKEGEFGNVSDSYLKIPAVSYKDSGNYECIANNGMSPSIRANFSLTIRESNMDQALLLPSVLKIVICIACIQTFLMSITIFPGCIATDIPEIQKFIFQDNIIQGKLVSATCLALSEVKPLQFHWTKDGTILKSDSQNVRIEDSNEYSILILNGVTLDNEGNYTCTATNIYGSSKHTAYLTVRAPPLWIKTPENITMAIGETVSFTCSASGSPKPRISWEKYSDNEKKWIVMNSNQDSNIEDKESSLKIKSLSYEDSGLYKCIASNAVKPNISANFTLTIRVKIEPFNFLRRFSIGEKAQTACFVVSESNDIQFQWFKDRLPLKESDNVRLKSSNEFSIIIIDPVDLSSEGNYTCKVTDGKDSAEYSALLQVQAAPSWLEETKDLTVAMGSTVTIYCRAHGSPKPQVKLKKVSGHFDIMSNNGSFVLESVTADHSGMYQCEASNDVGSLISKNFSIAVEEAIILLLISKELMSIPDSPKIQPFHFPKNVKIGSRVTVVCSVESALETVTFRWLKNREEITSTTEIRIKNDADFSVLVIEPVQINSTGNYSCSIRSSAGEDSFSAFLQVEGPPKWIQEPSDVSIHISEKIILKCEASGFPKPKITWFKIKEHPTGDVNAVLDSNVWNDTLLMIPEVDVEHSGLYLCEADNKIPPKLKATTRIRVIDMKLRDKRRQNSIFILAYLLFSLPNTFQELPKIQPFNFKQGVRIGDKTSATCLAESKSLVKYLWKKDGEFLSERGELRLKTDEEFSILIIEPVKIEYSGNYTCMAENKHGSDSFTAELLVEAPPIWIIEPENITVVPGTRHIFRCSASGSPKPVITWKKLSEETGKEVTAVTIFKGESLTLDSVSLTDGGTYECEAHNGVEPTLKKFVMLGIRGTRSRNFLKIKFLY
ncbi:titin [Nephila pilipes]|uniref:Titin n=1 Tax=Nephila pilipes TaxID=299642 RepID=A0A8X6QNH5_NEPPI|nr:titin [Nephila pilipes]